MKNFRSIIIGLPWVTLGIGILVIILGLSEKSAQLCQWDRSEIFNGEFWRLMTGHLVHCSPAHVFWDLIVFLSIGVILERIVRPAKFLGHLIIMAIGISLCLLVLEPNLQYYRGLSGLDSALFITLMVSMIARNEGNRAQKAIILALIPAFAGKCLFEFFTGNSAFVSDYAVGFSALPSAHLIGLTVAILVLAGKQLLSLQRKTTGAGHPLTL